jgi:hypothetical protein
MVVRKNKSEVDAYLDVGDDSVGMATGYELDGRVSIAGRGKIFYSIPQRTD